MGRSEWFADLADYPPFSRRQFLIRLSTILAGAAAFSACRGLVSTRAVENPPASSNVTESGIVSPITGTDELGNAITPYDAITSYNNFYEFSIAKEGIGNIARTFKFKTSPWEIEIGGLVKNPKTFDVDDLRQKFPPEERIYRMRCVEGWSMVIPWNGFPLSKLLQEVEPTPEAKYVRFEALYNPEQMPGQLSGVLPWPYVEGLRLDEAMNELTILATGIEDKPLLPQNGAPIRLVAPWKYGFKNIKSIVKIELTDQEPVSAWMFASPKEYGFYANVNPDVPHPRWPQSSERIIGELFRRQTLLFNGYGDKVAHLYRDLDLKKFF